MSTLHEIASAIHQLTEDDLTELERIIHATRREKSAERSIDAFALPPLDLGELLQPLGDREEWYDEMLKERV